VRLATRRYGSDKIAEAAVESQFVAAAYDRELLGRCGGLSTAAVKRGPQTYHPDDGLPTLVLWVGEIHGASSAITTIARCESPTTSIGKNLNHS
jgi:hypothetical protein